MAAQALRHSSFRHSSFRPAVIRHLFALALLTLLAACGQARPHPAQDTAPHPAVACREGFVQANGAVLDYAECAAPGASGRPLLAIIGYAMTREMWDQGFVRALSSGRRVILLDNRGMGAHPAPDGPMPLPLLAADAAALLDALGVSGADVLGWSMGGMVAQELALARPELVRSLVLLATVPEGAAVAPALDRMAAMSPAQFAASLFPLAGADRRAEYLSRMPARPRPPDMGVIARQDAAMRGWTGGVARLAVLRMPVLLLAGSEDWVCPAGESRRMAEAIPGAQLELVPGGGHWMMHQEPEALARKVAAFLDR